VPVLCASALEIDAPSEASPGERILISISADEPMPLRYAIYDGNDIISDWQTTKGNVSFKPRAAHAGRTLMIEAIAEREGCSMLRQSASVSITGIDNSAPLTPANLAPWIIAGVAILIAAALVWKR
jgi:hypothetical protein